MLELVRAEVRRARTLPLRQPEPAAEPTLVVSEQTVASLVRRVADQESLVEARRCSVRALDGESAPGEAAALAVELRLSVAVRAPIPVVTARLRADIIAVVASRPAAATATEVESAVADLLGAAHPGPVEVTVRVLSVESLGVGSL